MEVLIYWLNVTSNKSLTVILFEFEKYLNQYTVLLSAQFFLIFQRNFFLQAFPLKLCVRYGSYDL